MMRKGDCFLRCFRYEEDLDDNLELSPSRFCHLERWSLNRCTIIVSRIQRQFDEFALTSQRRRVSLVQLEGDLLDEISGDESSAPASFRLRQSSPNIVRSSNMVCFVLAQLITTRCTPHSNCPPVRVIRLPSLFRRNQNCCISINDWPVDGNAANALIRRHSSSSGRGSWANGESWGNLTSVC